HFGPAFVLVKSGTLALTRADGCETNVYHAGEGFAEAPNDVHIGRNIGSVPVDIIATYTNVPIGGSVARSVDAPTACAWPAAGPAGEPARRALRRSHLVVMFTRWVPEPAAEKPYSDCGLESRRGYFMRALLLLSNW